MRRRRPRHDNVELNLAAMLDMAFQLLTFFILTFKPAPVEGQIHLNLPPAQASIIVPPDKHPPGGEPLKNINTLPIRVVANAAGQVGELSLGDDRVDGLEQLDQRLKGALRDPTLPFDRVVIEASPALQYQPLMQVMEICAHQTLANGKRLTNVGIAELSADGR